jgi:alcohol dehydrogenase class IV
MLHGSPIAQRLADVGLDSAKTDFVADEVAKLSITAPRPVSAADVRSLLAAAY